MTNFFYSIHWQAIVHSFKVALYVAAAAGLLALAQWLSAGSAYHPTWIPDAAWMVLINAVVAGITRLASLINQN